MILEKYKGKTIKVFLKNGIKYEGVVKEVESSFLILKDIKVGDVVINVTNISDFREV